MKPALDALNKAAFHHDGGPGEDQSDVTANLEKTMKTAEEMLAFGQGNSKR